jgi:hypothetical protein
MIPATALEYLMRLGRQRGALDIDDIRQVLQVDTMSMEDLADAVARLEDAGVPVEIDPALLARRRDGTSPQEATLASVPIQRSEQAAEASDRPSTLSSSIRTARGHLSASTRPTGKHAQGSAVIFVLAAALILLILVLGLWHFV